MGDRAQSVDREAAEPAEVCLVVYDVRGREVEEVHAGPLAAGEREWALDTSAWAAGVYAVRVEAAGRTAAVTLTVVR